MAALHAFWRISVKMSNDKKIEEKRYDERAIEKKKNNLEIAKNPSGGSRPMVPIVSFKETTVHGRVAFSIACHSLVGVCLGSVIL